MADMVRVTANNPCPVCRRPDWCLVAPDRSAARCQRIAGEYPASPAGYYHRLTERNTRVTLTRTKPKPKDMTDWEAWVKRYASVTWATQLAGELGLPRVEYIPGVGRCPTDGNGPCYTIPMVNGARKVVGVQRRYDDGGKKMLGNAGLFVGANWHPDGPLFVAEGASDVMAMAAAGLNAVGRPSNNGGVEMLTALLWDWPDERPIIVVGERDEKANGLWPGLAAADVAKRLRKNLRTKLVKWVVCPTGFKDVREYLCGFTPPVGWELRGAALREELEEAATVAGDEYETLCRAVVWMQDQIRDMRQSIRNVGGDA